MGVMVANKKRGISDLKIFLIIAAVVFVIVLSLSGSGNIPVSTYCSAESGFDCTNFTVLSQNVVSLSFTEYVSTNYYNVKVACIIGSLNQSSNIIWYNLTVLNSSSKGELSFGKQIYIKSLPCFRANGAVGSEVPANLWLNVTNNNATPTSKNGSNPTVLRYAASLSGVS